MAKLKNFGNGSYGFNCPGCGQLHAIPTIMEHSNGIIWTFNNDLQRPTFSPSVRLRWGKFVDPNWDDEGITNLSGQCHFFIKNGCIEFCTDSTHEMAGKTVELPEVITNY